MPQATFHFPTGFLWGTATAAHQVEGNNTNNNWSAWEQQPGRVLHGQKAGLACDWWGGRWKEDFDRAAESGQNAHRLSVEWSRVQPEPDRWDEDALDHYRQMVRGLIQRGMTPMVTLHHFTDPLWLVERGGWENPETAGLFARFARKVVEALQEYVTLWVTINEPNVYSSLGYITGEFPPGTGGLGTAYRVMETMVQAHAAAYQAIHAQQPHSRVGIAVNTRGFKPARPWLPLDTALAGIHHAIFNDFFPRALTQGVLNFVYRRSRIPQAARTLDFLGIQYYTTELVAFHPLAWKTSFVRRYFPDGSDLSDSAYLANVPSGMLEFLQWGTRFNVPLIVTENGVDDADDHLRPRFLLQHLHQVWRGINFNWPVKGYFHWTLVDNFEWERGWTQRFGLWELDLETQVRRKRPSADLYAAICKENAISSDLVAHYAPEVLGKMFPG